MKQSDLERLKDMYMQVYVDQFKRGAEAGCTSNDCDLYADDAARRAVDSYRLELYKINERLTEGRNND